MMRFVEAARRSGKLSLVPPILEAAEKHSNRAKYESGLFYCKGLYEWHTGETYFFINKVENDPSSSQRTGNSNEAIKHFYSIRYDTELGRKATYHIIEICINPDNQTFGGEVFESLNSNLKWVCSST